MKGKCSLHFKGYKTILKFIANASLLTTLYFIFSHFQQKFALKRFNNVNKTAKKETTEECQPREMITTEERMDEPV